MMVRELRAATVRIGGAVVLVLHDPLEQRVVEGAATPLASRPPAGIAAGPLARVDRSVVESERHHVHSACTTRR